MKGVVRKLQNNAPSLGFWGPTLNLSEPNASEGTAVTVTCAAGARVQVMLEGLPAAAPGQPAQFQLNATEMDDRRSFFCNATLEVDGETLHRNSSIQLRVLCEWVPMIFKPLLPLRHGASSVSNHLTNPQTVPRLTKPNVPSA